MAGSAQTEREFKYMLTGEGAKALERHLGAPAREGWQRNRYWRADLAPGWVLRCREEPWGFTLTVKGPGTLIDGCKTCPEFEAPVTAEFAAALASQVDLAGIAPLFAAPPPPLGMASFAGGLENHRKTWLREGLEVSLDRFSLPDGLELHELEIELQRDLADQTPFVAELQALGVGLVPSGKSKFRRLLESIRASLSSPERA